MLERQYTIHNRTGLHARPASQFVKLASRFDSDVKVTCEGRASNAKSIIGVLGLGMSKDKAITLTVDGGDEVLVMSELLAFLDNLTE